MPVLSIGHSKFWKQRSNPVQAAGPVQGVGNYPAWQSSVIVCASLLGGLQLLWERVAYACRWCLLAWRWSKEPRRVEALLGVSGEAWATLSADQRRAMTQALRIVRSPLFPAAQAMVFNTSRAERFHEHQAWNAVSTSLAAAGQGHAENIWRHLHAVEAFRVLHPEMSNPDRHLLIELAYHEFAASGRGKPSMDR